MTSTDPEADVLTPSLPVYQDLYKMLSQVCCFITVFVADEVISEGTGYAIGHDGTVFTAAHVVTGRMPIRESDYRDPDLKIFAKFPGVPVLEYRVAICGIHIDVSAFKAGVQIDQAILMPAKPLTQSLPAIPVGPPPQLGEEVFFAGFSDELELPFSLERIVRPEVAGVAEFLEALRIGYRADMTGPLIKRGVVGNVRRLCTSEIATNTEIECEIFYVDNTMHAGASGGPIVNRSGQAVGVIVQRATTSASQSDLPGLKVPSGATVGLGLQTIPAMLRRLSGG